MHPLSELLVNNRFTIDSPESNWFSHQVLSGKQPSLNATTKPSN